MSIAPPWTLTETGLILKPGLTIKEWARALDMLGDMGKGLGWWICDVLEYGEAEYGEQMAQFVDRLGLQPHRIATLLWVARKWPRSRRRDDMSFGHHEALAALEPDQQDAWMQRVAEGDVLPNLERRRWSVTRLRRELRALSGPSASPALLPETNGSGSSDSTDPDTVGSAAVVLLRPGMRVAIEGDVDARCWSVTHFNHNPPFIGLRAEC